MAKKQSIVAQELDQLPLEEMVIEAMSEYGVSYRALDLYAGSLPCLTIVVVGDVAKEWLDLVDCFVRACSRGAGIPSDPSAPAVPPAHDLGGGG